MKEHEMQTIQVRNADLHQYVGHELQIGVASLGYRWERIVAVQPSDYQGIQIETTGGSYQACFMDMERTVNASTYWGDTNWAAENVGLD
jgi:hypothetical protein